MMPFRRENRHLTLSLVAIIVGLFVVAIGVQAYIAQQDKADRDAARLDRERADRAYADCLTDFAADLVDTIRARTQANVRLERAAEAKDDALDALLAVTAGFYRTPPRGTEDDFRGALLARVRAQNRYARVKARVAAVRADNDYVSPKVVCAR